MHLIHPITIQLPKKSKKKKITSTQLSSPSPAVLVGDGGASRRRHHRLAAQIVRTPPESSAGLTDPMRAHPVEVIPLEPRFPNATRTFTPSEGMSRSGEDPPPSRFPYGFRRRSDIAMGFTRSVDPFRCEREPPTAHTPAPHHRPRCELEIRCVDLHRRPLLALAGKPSSPSRFGSEIDMVIDKVGWPTRLTTHFLPRLLSRSTTAATSFLVPRR